MRRFLYDTSVFIYALGRPHPYREPCREIVARAQRGELRGEASVDLIHEFVQVRIRRGHDRQLVVRQVRDVERLCRLHDFAVGDVPLFRRLFSEHIQLNARDAVFAATALNRGIDAILSADRDFDGIPGLVRVDPADREAVDAFAAQSSGP